MKLRKRILAVLLAVSMTATGSGFVYAAETVSSAVVTASENETGDVKQEVQSENKAEEKAGDAQDKAAEASENAVPENAAPENGASENEAPSEDSAVSENGAPVAEAEVEEAVSGNTADSVIKGLPDGFKLSEAELLGKKRIAEHDVVSELEKLTPGVDYVEDEVIFSCDDPEYAKTVAEAYGGTLDSCELGVAVIKLDPAKVTVKDAVAAGADPATLLPPVDVNTKNYLTDPVKEASAAVTDNSFMGGALASKKNAIDGRDWTYWTSKYNDPALKPDFTFNDPDAQNILKNGYQWMHDAVDSYKAWGVTRGAGVTVAVIDTGVYAGHPDLGGRVNDDAKDTTNFKSMVDTSGHGTHVAGIIGAQANNTVGGTGIAPEVDILAVPVFVSNYYESKDLVKGINYVTNGGKPLADVINMSLGGPIYNESEQTAVSNAHNAGITVCVAMGNDHANCRKYPVGYDDVIAVAALDESWQKSDFSTFGSWADVAAPGTAIFSTWNGHYDETASGGGKNTTTDYSYYTSWDGTSMATPVVSGVCALYISAAKAAGFKPDPDDVEAAIKKSATKVSSSYQIGSGMVNAANMLSLLEDKSAPSIKVPGTLSSNSSITLSDNKAAGGTLGYIYTINGKKPSAEKGDVKEGFYKEALNGAADITVSELIENGLMADESVTLQVVRITGIGTATEIASEVITINSSSVPAAKISGPEKLARGKSAVYTLKPAFPKGKVKWSVEGSGVTVNAKTGKVTAKKSSSGSFTVKAEAEGKTATLKVELVNPASFITLKAEAADKDINAPVTANNGNLKSARMYNVDLRGNTKTENILKLTGSADNKTDVVFTSSKPSVAEVDKDGKITAKKAGTTKITCKATDGSGKKSTATVKVIVPVSRIDMFLDKGMQAIGYGKTVKVRPALGSAYGKPSIKKLEWDKDPVKVVGYKGSSGSDVTAKIKSSNYITVKNGNIKVNKNIKTMGYAYFDVTVKAKATDGSGITGEKKFLVIPPTTFMKSKFRSPQKVNVGLASEVALFTGNLGYDYSLATSRVVIPEVKSSNPKVASAYVSGYRGGSDGLEYTCILVCERRGSATITIKATDGSGKKASLKVIVK